MRSASSSPCNAKICVSILYLPSSSAGTVMPFWLAIARNPVTASSRVMISAAIQAGTRGSPGNATSITNTAATSSLSASGSRNCPSVDTIPWRRAR
jgi:hypothetical protein